jgi:hypothetical protein
VGRWSRLVAGAAGWALHINDRKGIGEHVTTTVDISTIDLQGRRVPVIHCTAESMTGALRIIDGASPAPANPYVRRRLRFEHGGVVTIGMVRAEVDQTA